MLRHIEKKKFSAGRIGVGLSHFDENYVLKDADDRFVPGTDGKVQRVRPVSLGERAIGFFSDEIDRLIEQLQKWRDASPLRAPKPAVPIEFHPSRHRKAKQQSGRLSPAAR